MKALVTGGGGFLGRGIVYSLLKRGDEVRTLTRGEYPELAEAGAETLRGSVADQTVVDRAVEGCDVVFHVAAKVGAAGRYEDFHATNVNGTQHVIDACRRHGVGALVYTSTPSVVFGHEDLEGVDESHPYPEDYEAFYPQTKAEAEKLVLAANDADLRTVALRPHIIWGPGDTSLLPRLLERAPKMRKIITKGAPKKMDVTYIDDAVHAHLLAAEKLRSTPHIVGGKPYFISSGAPVEIWQFIDDILVAAGRPPIKKTAPRSLAMLAGWIFETAHRVSGASGEPRMSRWIVRELTTSHWFNTSAAEGDLGYAGQHTLESGLKNLSLWALEPDPR